MPDLPDADAIYENYLKTCAMLGVEPVSRKRAGKLVAEWTATIGPLIALIVLAAGWWLISSEEVKPEPTPVVTDAIELPHVRIKRDALQ